MKMISKTSRMSIIGVTLISAAAPRVLPMLIAMAGSPFHPRSRLLPGHDLRRHNAYVIYVGLFADIDHLGNVHEVDIGIAPDKHHALGAVGVNLSQLGQ